MRLDIMGRPHPRVWPPDRMPTWWYWTSAPLLGVLVALLLVWLAL